MGFGDILRCNNDTNSGLLLPYLEPFALRGVVLGYL